MHVIYDRRETGEGVVSGCNDRGMGEREEEGCTDE
jgi:hypothetical protein